MKGKLYGIGVGPGDPELLTLKAKRLIEECDIVAVPVKKEGEDSVAQMCIRDRPYSLIMKRVDCAGQGDFIVCFYNPKSKKRADYVEKAAEILMKYRDGKTPVGIVRHAGREEESSYITTLDAVKDAPIDMFSIVIVGNSNTYVRDGKMITPRGYEDKYGFANVEQVEEQDEKYHQNRNKKE